MTTGKPDDIPQDVWDAAGDYADELHLAGDCMFLESRKVIARAILAAKAEERQNAIGVVLSFERHHGEPGAVASNPYADVRVIAAAIRKRGEG